MPANCQGEAEVYCSWAKSLPECDWDFLCIEKGGILTIKKGYRWDGATNVSSDKVYHHRSSLIHDALYDLMRMHYLEPDTFEKGDPAETDNAGDYNRKMTDMIYFMIAVEDGESVDKAELDFSIIRGAGWIGTSTEFQLKSWKFHVSELSAFSSDKEIRLEWKKCNSGLKNTDPSNCGTYTLLRNGEVYDVVDSSSTYYVDNNVENGRLYSYQLVSGEYLKDIYNWSNEEYAVPNKDTGNFLTLDGQDDYFTSNTVCNDLCYTTKENSDQSPSNYALEAWVYPESKPGKNAIFAFNTITGGRQISLLYDGNIQQFVYYDKVVGYTGINKTFSPGKWYHVALTFDSLQHALIYVGGVEATEFSTYVRPAHGDRFSVGQEWDGDITSRFFKGRIDEVRIWKTFRAQEQIIQDMYSQLKGDEKYLMGLWHFDEFQPVYTTSYWGNIPLEHTIKSYDASAYGNDGTINGYKPTGVSIQNPDLSDSQVSLQSYPNPFTDALNVEFYAWQHYHKILPAGTR